MLINKLMLQAYLEYGCTYIIVSVNVYIVASLLFRLFNLQKLIAMISLITQNIEYVSNRIVYKLFDVQLRVAIKAITNHTLS